MLPHRRRDRPAPFHQHLCGPGRCVLLPTGSGRLFRRHGHESGVQPVLHPIHRQPPDPVPAAAPGPVRPAGGGAAVPQYPPGFPGKTGARFLRSGNALAGSPGGSGQPTSGVRGGGGRGGQAPGDFHPERSATPGGAGRGGAGSPHCPGHVQAAPGPASQCLCLWRGPGHGHARHSPRTGGGWPGAPQGGGVGAGPVRPATGGPAPDSPGGGNGARSGLPEPGQPGRAPTGGKYVGPRGGGGTADPVYFCPERHHYPPGTPAQSGKTRSLRYWMGLAGLRLGRPGWADLRHGPG